MEKFPTDGSLNNSSLISADKVFNNEDLRREIFLRLPVRSLIKFKLVSKQWYSLISDRQFACYRTSRSNPNSIVPSGLYFYDLLTGRGSEVDSISLDLSSIALSSREIDSVSVYDSSLGLSSLGIQMVSDDDPSIEFSRVRVPSLSFLHTAGSESKIRILQTCNGLLFCKLKSTFEHEIIVCNPTTKSYRILPKPCPNPRAYALAFDPSISPHFKVICCNTISKGNHKIEIYSSETSEWSTSTNCSDLHFGGYLESTAYYWNGSIHWIGGSGLLYYHYTYDLIKDVFKIFDIPWTDPEEFEGLRHFGGYRGVLHVVYVKDSCADTLYVLERDIETMIWSLKYRVCLGQLQIKFPNIAESWEGRWRESHFWFLILSVLKGENEDLGLVLIIREKVIYYSVHHKKAKVICELLPEEDFTDIFFDYCTTGFDFIESLALV